MAQVKKEYVVLDDFKTIAEKLITKYPDIFYGIKVEEVRCVVITNKERGEKQDKLWELVPVKMPIRMDCKFGWYVILHQSDWDAMGVKTRNQLVCQILCAIPFGDDGEGKVNPQDYKDYSLMLRTFGVDYLDRTDSKDPLAEDVNWVR